MNSKILLDSLTEQEKNLDGLFQILETMKKAIVQNDFKTFEQTIGQEQVILKKIKIEDDNRKKAMLALAEYLSLGTDISSLEKLIKAGKPKLGKEYDALEKVRYSLKEKLKNISHLNLLLREIIDISRNFIKETLMIVAGQKRHGLINKRVF